MPYLDGTGPHGDGPHGRGMGPCGNGRTGPMGKGMGRGRRRMCAPIHAQQVSVIIDPKERLSQEIEVLEARVKALRGRLENMGDTQ